MCRLSVHCPFPPLFLSMDDDILEKSLPQSVSIQEKISGTLHVVYDAHGFSNWIAWVFNKFPPKITRLITAL